MGRLPQAKKRPKQGRGRVQPLPRFFAKQRNKNRREFLAEFTGAFLLARTLGSEPKVLILPRDPATRVSVGACGEECDLACEWDTTLDQVHAVFVYHVGFAGWIVEDNNTRFGTRVNGDRLAKDSIHLLRDRELVQLGGDVSQLEFYSAAALYDRMARVGITRRT